MNSIAPRTRAIILASAVALASGGPAGAVIAAGAAPAATAPSGATAAGAMAAGTAKRYPLDTNHSTIGFGASILKLSKVTGKFADFNGAIVVLDPQDPTTSAVELTIKAASISTGIAERDADLRGPAFFDVVKYPEITFKSTKVRKDGANYVMDGTFTMHGVTKGISIPFRLLAMEQVAAAEAHFTLNRQDYGVSWTRKMDDGSLFVADEVAIDLYVLTKLGKPYVPGTPVVEPAKTSQD